MLTYTPPSEQQLPATTEKPWALLLLCLFWLLPGLIGRQPLRPDEIINADIVRQMLDGGGWLLPKVAGEPWLERMPLYYWVAAGCGWLGSQLGLALHDGARLATLLFTSLALWGSGLAGRELIGRRHGRSAVMILLGSVGLLLPGHMLTADSAVLAGWCWGIYSLALAPRQPLPAALLLGAAMVVCGLSASLIEPLLLLLLAGLCLVQAHWRKGHFAFYLLWTLALALPLLACWPLALRSSAPQAFSIWWGQAALGWFGGFDQLRFFHSFGRYLRLLPWFAWPGWFLAGATLWMQGNRWREARFFLPLAAFLLCLLALTLGHSERSNHALLLLPPLALIGAAGLDVLRRGASAFVNWFGVVSFGLLGLFIWLAWSAMHLGWPPRWTERAQELNPGFQAELSWPLLALGLAMSAVWFWAVSRQRPVGRQAVTNWAAGITLCWGLFTAFGTHWVNYRSSFQELAQAVSRQLPAQQCIYGPQLSWNEKAMLHYYLGLHVSNQQSRLACNWLLQRQGRVSSSALLPGWQAIWQGGRAGDRDELLVLYRKTES